MAIVMTVPGESKLTFKFVIGTNPTTGAPILKSKTFSKIQSIALDQDVYDVATALVGLQKYTVDEITITKSWQLTE